MQGITAFFDWLTGLAASFWNQTPFRYWVAFLLIGLLLEVLLKAEKGQPWRNIWFNIRYSVIYLVVIFLLSPALNTAVAQIVALIGGGFIYLDVFAQNDLLGQIGAATLSVFFIDFFYYWWHRTQHTMPWLWDQHALHHSDESLNVSTSIRHHWSEFIIQAFVITLPMAILFKLTPVNMWVVSTVVSFWSWFIHLNIRLHLGKFSWVIAGPQLHRIHHSMEPQHIDKNFAAYFPIWDVLFGTYYAPARDEYPRTGIPDGPVKSVTEASVYPAVRWLRRVKRKARASGESRGLGR